MATTPTTSELNATIIAQLEASLNQTIPLLPKSFLRVLAKVLAGVNIILYKYAGFMFLQIFVDTATIDETEVNGVMVSPLIAWGRLIGVGDPTKATNAEMLVEVTVTNQTGTLPSGSQLLGSANGITYLTTAPVLLDAPTVSVAIIAAGDQAGGNGSGAIGNLQIGDSLSFANPLPNIEAATLVTDILVTAADAEDTEIYRQRVKDRFQKRPQGGAYADYELWGEEVQGIVNVYPYTSACPGQVDVYVEATEASSGSPDGIPTDAQLEAVLESIELDDTGLATRRPANALVNAFPIKRLAFNTTVVGLQVGDQATTQARIDQGVLEYFQARDIYIPGLSILPRLDRITASGVGGLVEDIVSAAGGIFLRVTLTLTSQSLQNSSYSGESKDVSTEEAAPTGTAWSYTGDKFFIVGPASATVYEYSVSVPFDLSSTVTYTGNSFDVSTQDATPESISFSSDGLGFMILGGTNARVFEYSVSVPFDLSSTVLYAGSSFDVSPQEPAPRGMDWGSNGDKFFIVGDGAEVFEYTVSAAYDLSSTVAYTGNSVDISTEEASPKSVFFSDRGSTMSIVGAGAKVYEYVLSVPYAFGTTVSKFGLGFSVAGQEAAPESFQYSLDGDKFFVIGAGAELFEYSTGTADLAIETYTLGEGEKAKSGGVTYS